MNPPRFQVTIIWQELIQLIQAISGISLKEATINNLKNYINQRINQLNIDLTEYYKLLKSSEPLKSAEWHNVIDKITNNESYFFRDRAQFQLLKNQIIPQLIKQQKLAKSITICSGGCSTGEEPLSLAILLQELIPDITNWDIKIIGIDLDNNALNKARQAIYGKWSMRGVEKQIIQQYFQLKNNSYHLKQTIKKMVRFHNFSITQTNLEQNFQQLGIKQIDLFICRNVFIYFQPQAIDKALTNIYNLLTPLGYLLVGHAEVYGQNLSKFTTLIYPESIIYQRPSLEKNVQLTVKKNPQKFPNITTPSRQKSLTFSSPNLPNASSIYSPQNKNKSNSLKTSLVNQKKFNFQPSKLNFTDIEKLYLNKQYDLAIVELENFLHKDINHLASYQLMAQIYADQGKYELAAAKCLKALDIDNLAMDAQYLLAQIELERNNPELAKEILRKILYLDVNFIPAYCDLARIYEKEKNYNKSKKMSQNALNLLRNIDENDTSLTKYGITINQLMTELENSLARL